MTLLHSCTRRFFLICPSYHVDEPSLYLFSFSSLLSWILVMYNVVYAL